MCRLCGRVVKCIFDSMPSRTPRVWTMTTPTPTPTTLLRQAGAASPRLHASQSILLSRPFSALSITPRARPSIRIQSPLSLPTTTHPPTTPTLQRLVQQRSSPFSTSSALQGHRRRMDTYSPSRKVQKRRHGYLARLSTKAGRAVLKRRKLKGKRFLSW